MKVLKVDRKEQYLEVVPQTLTDLWHLERIIEPSDLVKGKSERKIKGEEGRSAQKITVSATVEAEKIEFHEHAHQLRVSGKLVELKPEEFFDAGAFHSVEVELNKKISIKKKKLKGHQIERLEKAVKASRAEETALVVLDDEEATIALLKEFGAEGKANIKSGKQGKRMEGEKGREGKYFTEITEKVRELNAPKTVVAGPGFTKNNFKKYLQEKGVKLNAFYASTNSVGITGLNELLASQQMEKFFEQSLILEENKLMEKALAEIYKGTGLTAYGLKELKEAVEKGAVGELMVSDKLLLEKRNDVEELLGKAEETGAKVHVLSSSHDAGKKLDGFGGGIAFLRFAVE